MTVKRDYCSQVSGLTAVPLPLIRNNVKKVYSQSSRLSHLFCGYNASQDGYRSLTVHLPDGSLWARSFFYGRLLKSQ
jgi:hypothetical protein